MATVYRTPVQILKGIEVSLALEARGCTAFEYPALSDISPGVALGAKHKRPQHAITILINPLTNFRDDISLRIKSIHLEKAHYLLIVIVKLLWQNRPFHGHEDKRGESVLGLSRSVVFRALISFSSTSILSSLFEAYHSRTQRS